MPKFFPIGPMWAKRITQMWEWQQGFRGDHVKNTGASVYVGSGDARASAAIPAPRRDFLAKITDSAEIAGESNRWKYAWHEVIRNTTGFQDRRDPVTDGRHGALVAVGDDPDTFAINAAEANNTSTGIQGNGSDLDANVFADNTDLAIAAIGGDAVVRMWTDRDIDTGRICYTFSQPNGVQGDCA